MKRQALAAGALVWMGLIFYASSLPSSSTGPDTPLWTLFLKALHFGGYGILALLFLGFFRESRNRASPLQNFFASLLLAAVYAVSDECHQAFSPGRHPSLRDVIIDTMGAGAFLAAFFLLQIKRTRGKPITQQAGREERGP